MICYAILIFVWRALLRSVARMKRGSQKSRLDVAKSAMICYAILIFVWRALLRSVARMKRGSQKCRLDVA